MSPRPPTSTLFPYTTLFRSQALNFTSRTPRQMKTLVLVVDTLRKRLREERQLSVLWHRRYHDCPKGDRKSTRLNSSHANISYAVFCLKKKKKTKKHKNHSYT